MRSPGAGGQDLFESFDQQLDIFFGGRGTHQSDPEDFSGERSESAQNFDPVFFEQPLSHLQIVHAFGNAWRIQRP